MRMIPVDATPREAADLAQVWLALVASAAHDDEAAHGYEDSLRDGVLRWIAANGAHHPTTAVLLAGTALMTTEIEFSRWCA